MQLSPRFTSMTGTAGTARMSRAAVGLTLAGLGLGLTACTGVQPADQIEANESVTVTTSESPSFEPSDVAPVEAEQTFGPVEDPGLGVTWHFQGTDYGQWGGTVIHVAVTNDNDVPLPPDAIPAPRLEYNTGGGNMTTADPLDTEIPEDTPPPLQVPLDIPLGVGATTNLHFTFDVSRANLWDAEFQVGNAVWSGNLIV